MNKSFLIQSSLINVGIAAAFIGVQSLAANAADLQGTFSFTDGLLEALNPSDPTDILFSADIVSILADPNTSMFSAKLRNFVPGSISPDSSPLLAEFISAGMGETWLDPAIIEVTESFSQAGTTSDVFLQDVVPSVPEPTSTLSFLALGTLGAASTFKRKLKPTKEKQLEKVS